MNKPVLKMITLRLSRKDHRLLCIEAEKHKISLNSLLLQRALYPDKPIAKLHTGRKRGRVAKIVEEEFDAEEETIRIHVPSEEDSEESGNGTDGS